MAKSLRDLLLALTRRLHRLRVPHVILIGLIIRLALAPITSWTQDAYPFYRAAVDMVGGLNPYDSAFYTYPPLWAYLIFPLTLLLGLLGGMDSLAAVVPSMGPTATLTEMIVPTVTSLHFNLALKLPLIAADLGIALLLFRWTSQVYGPDKGKSALLLWFFNPLVIWVNAAQGQFDVIPSFLTLLSCLLLANRRYLFGGLGLGLAILFKFYPIFLVIPLLFLVLRLERRREGEGWSPFRSALLFLGGLGAALVTMGLPLLGTRFVDVVFVRRAQFAPLGGFNPLFFLTLDIWERLPFAGAILTTLPRMASPYLLAVPLVASLLAGIAIYRGTEFQPSRQRVIETVAYLTVITFVILYTALTLVNPQHLLWVLPFLILGSARWRRLIPYTLVVSLTGLLFLFALQSPSAFFYPAAVFTQLIEVRGINAQVVGYWNLPGLISSKLHMDLIFFASGFGYSALLMAAYMLAKRWKASREDAQSPATVAVRLDRGDITTMTRFMVGVVAILLVSQTIVLTASLPSGGSVLAVRHDTARDLVEVKIRGHGLYASSYLVTAIGLLRQPRELPISLYLDERYPVSNTSIARIFGIADHLSFELRSMGRPTDIRFVDTAALFALLRGPPAILIMASTALPEELFFLEPTLLKSWLERGGILIWTGALIGGYMATREGKVVDMVGLYPDEGWGPSFIIGFDPVGDMGLERAETSTPWRDALDIRYPLAGWGATLTAVGGEGGLILGATTSGGAPKTSLSVLPVGKGTLALFGDAAGPVITYTGEDIIAHDIARLVLSGILDNPRANETTLIGSTVVDLRSGEDIRVSLPLQLNGISLVRVVVQSLVDYDTLIAANDLLVLS